MGAVIILPAVLIRKVSATQCLDRARELKRHTEPSCTGGYPLQVRPLPELKALQC
jgi:hypothetical protein